MIVSESLPSRPMDSKEAAQEKEMDPLPLLRNGVLAAAPFLLVISVVDPDRKIRMFLLFGRLGTGFGSISQEVRIRIILSSSKNIKIIRKTLIPTVL